ncbi:hypothetical protein POF45_03345 [Pseudomonas sp. 681]|uniref:T6SS Phospholipase effector Tle1-like C-terminal domain-containing protein n=1 Tax=Pseudomonas fungipugnans TaxID=3024217 RepID=A0ABT6QHU6_9PSED|nr:hypothetical protein [Pseudomonas sp. 681]MDI2590467.1 hypothetical protein [Pseudomonas sp. 681]
MSEVKHASVWVPPPFPLQGRLPSRVEQGQQNILRQCEQERGYQDALCLAAGYRVTPPCCRPSACSSTVPAMDETGNAMQPAGLLRALFDDQVHDSRAWFLYSPLFGREPIGSYFRERMVFFGEASRRELALNPEAKATMLAAGTPLPASESVVAAHPPVMDAQRMAEAQQAIKAHWDAYYAKVGEVNNARA